MTKQALLERRAELLEEAEALTRTGDLDGDDAARFEEIENEIEDVNQRLAIINGVASGRYSEVSVEEPRLLSRRDPYEQPAKPESASEVRSRALTAIEGWNADDRLKADATRTVENAGANSPDAAADTRGVAGHVLRFSHPLYISAFRKFANDPEGYVADLDPDERRVWQEAREYQRAVLQTSGAVLPSPLDPTIVLTNAGDVDPMRQIARIDSTPAKEKRYITSAGSTFSFDAENTEVSDDTHTETEVTITTQKAQGFIQATIETAMDQPNFSEEVAKIIADGKARLEASKFVTGTGTNEPKGINVALDGTAAEVSPALAEKFASGDVYATQEALPARWRPRASWVAELSTINEIDQFETTNGAKLFPQVGEANPVLLRRRLYENSNVDAHSDIDDTVTADNHILYFGDFGQYVILDRIGLSVAFIGPGVLQNTANNLPDGRVAWYAWWRVGAEILTVNAFKVLNVNTTL